MAVPSVEKRIQQRLGELTSHRGGQADMVVLTGTSDDVVSRYVTGKRQPSHDFLLRVAEAYGVSIDWLYGRATGQADFVWTRADVASRGAKPPDYTDAVIDRVLARWSQQAAPSWARELTTEIEATVREVLGGPTLLKKVARAVLDAQELALREEQPEPSDDAGRGSGARQKGRRRSPP